MDDSLTASALSIQALAGAEPKQQTSEGHGQPERLPSSVAEKETLPEDFADINDSIETSSRSRPASNFDTMDNPVLLPCVIEVSNLPVMGRVSLDQIEPLQVSLKLDCGLYEYPQISLQFIGPSPENTIFGEVRWGVTDFINDRWLIKDLEIEALDEKEVAACRETVEFQVGKKESTNQLRLIFIDVVEVRSRSFKPEIWNNIDRQHHETLAVLFNRKTPYQIKIWFEVPAHLPNMDVCHLQVFRDSVSRRRSPLYYAVDRNGRRFIDLRNS